MDSVARLNEPAPRFELADLSGRVHDPNQARGQILVLNFWSAECPWSARADEQLAVLRPAWGEAVQLWPIASNVNESAEAMRAAAEERGLACVLRDADHAVADLYGAQTTPHFYVIDREGVLRYAGALDDITFRKREAEGHYLADAVRALLDGRQPDPQETPGYGCTIVRHKL